MNNKGEMVATLDRYRANRMRCYSGPSFLASPPGPGTWGIRAVDKRGGGGLFIGDLTTPQVLEYLRQLVSVHLEAVSVWEYADPHLVVIQGEVEWYRDEFGEHAYRGWICNIPGLTLRPAGEHPYAREIKRRTDVPDRVLNFILMRGIFGAVVEFSIFRKPLGMQNDNLVIWEIRRY